MVRCKKLKKDLIEEEKVKVAIKDVIEKKFNISQAARVHNLKRTTLRDRVKKFKIRNMTSLGEEYSTKFSTNQVFNKRQETELCEYFKSCSTLQHGFTYVNARRFVYQYAITNEIGIPRSWTVNEMAGVDWVQGFMKRNHELSLRKPQNCSINRLTAFNKTAVVEFFDNAQKVLLKYSLAPCDIYNLDETGISTVLQTPKVISTKGQRTVSQVVSAERGPLVTMVGIVSASGNALPPVYVFPRVRYNDHFVNGGPNGCIGLADKSGWMTAELFVDVLKHIKANTHCSNHNPIILFLDNHASHCSLAAINFCRENGINMITFPPHTSHKLQPLDISVLGPFKKYLGISFNDFHVSNPGKHISIYDIPTLSNIPFQKAFVLENICKGFEKAGISPFNRQIFPESDFVIDGIEEYPTEQIVNQNEQILQDEELLNNIDNLARLRITPQPSSKSPEEIRPLPKIRKIKSNKRKGKSVIMTSSPFRKQKESMQHEKKVTKQQPKKRKIEPKGTADKKQKCKKSKKKIVELSSTDVSEDMSIADSDQSVGSFAENGNIYKNKFVLARFGANFQQFHVGKIISSFTNSVALRFLQRKQSSWVFCEQQDGKVSIVHKKDIVLVLPEPMHVAGTSSSAASYFFDIDISHYNVK
ncbi:uncharacterized protein [Musca autumnalis]|uniref:uncharacterized protein n=1 Tax=Musca autumnalis TaxID=221902 RepID=UPI003CFAAB11